MGTVCGIMLCENGHDVKLWARRPEHAAELTETRENSRYLPGISIPDSIGVTDRIDRAVSGAGIVVFAVPTHTMRAVAADAVPHIAPDAVIVNTSKGLEEGSLDRMSGVRTEATGLAPARVLSLVGPSHAEEVSRHIEH